MSLWGQDYDLHPSLQTGRLKCSKVKSIVPRHRWWVTESDQNLHTVPSPLMMTVCADTTPLCPLGGPSCVGSWKSFFVLWCFWKPTSKVPGSVSLTSGSAKSVCFQPSSPSGCPRRSPSTLTLETTCSVLGMLMSVNPVGKPLPHKTHLLSQNKQVTLQRDSPGPWILHSGSSFRTRASSRWAYS